MVPTLCLELLEIRQAVLDKPLGYGIVERNRERLARDERRALRGLIEQSHTLRVSAAAHASQVRQLPTDGSEGERSGWRVMRLWLSRTPHCAAVR